MCKLSTTYICIQLDDDFGAYCLVLIMWRHGNQCEYNIAMTYDLILGPETAPAIERFYSYTRKWFLDHFRFFNDFLTINDLDFLTP